MVLLSYVLEPAAFNTILKILILGLIETSRPLPPPPSLAPSGPRQPPETSLTLGAWRVLWPRAASASPAPNGPRTGAGAPRERTGPACARREARGSATVRTRDSALGTRPCLGTVGCAAAPGLLGPRPGSAEARSSRLGTALYPAWRVLARRRWGKGGRENIKNLLYIRYDASLFICIPACYPCFTGCPPACCLEEGRISTTLSSIHSGGLILCFSGRKKILPGKLIEESVVPLLGLCCSPDVRTVRTGIAK
ncbi:uncharacterized protein LOC125933127 [Panthera uncia]|uniref:uncharacterized protein LOC125933127 n=1 Tax=Panthera uncia TaxID=29064 RepID=UPI0020FFED80|nr:uncharacterized protein LOC125933127 [Panthera uncia]